MWVEIRNSFTSIKFWISLTALTICLFGFSLPVWLVRVSQGDKMYMSGVSQGFSPIFFGGAILLFPFCAALAYAPSQVEDIRTGFCFMKAFRSSVLKYSMNKLAAVALSGAVAMGTACLIHFVVWNIVAGPYDPVTNPIHEVSFASGTVYADLMLSPYGWKAFAHAIIGFAITGAVWAVLALTFAVWIADSLLVITLPVAIYYFMTYRFVSQLFGVFLPTPSALYNDGQYWHIYYTALFINSVFLFISSLVYYKGVKERLTNG